MNWKMLHFCWVGLLAFVACSDSDNNSSGSSSVCGLTCSGSVSCASSAGVYNGTASVSGVACVLKSSDGSVSLACDNTATFTDASGSGSDKGTWSGSGTSVSLVDPGGDTWTCTISPPAGTGGSGGSATGSGGTGGSVAGTGGSVAGTGGGGSGDACEVCIESNCGAQTSACENNSQCVNLLYCVLECDTEACADSCVQSYPSGVEPLGAMLDCWTTYCESACTD